MKTTHGSAGFTLVEVLLALLITAMVMASVSATFITTLEAREDVASMTESTEAGPRILALLERDLQGLWHHNIKNNAVLRGRNLDIAGTPADRIDFLTHTDAVGVVMDIHNTPRRPPICEVGYWLKRNERTHDLLELWRREDPMVDNDLLTGGEFQMVHDRIKSFNITYYKTLGAKAESDAKTEWNSAEEDSLPRRIKIEFTVERRLQNTNRIGTELEEIEGVLKTYVHHVVLDARYPTILQPNVALIAMTPGEPEEGSIEGGGGGGGGPSAAAGGLPSGNAPFVPGGDRGRQGGPGGERGSNPGIETRGGPGGGFPGGGQFPPGGGLPGGIDLGSLLRGAGGGGGGGGGRR